MANRRICIQIDFDGPNPLIINSNGTSDKRTSMLNLARLLRGTDTGAQFRQPKKPTTVVVQASLVQASATATPASVQSGDTLSIGGTALTATQGRASGTVTAAAVNVGDTVTVNGVVFTAVAGAPGTNQFDQSGTNTQTATSLAAAINACTDPKVQDLIGAKSAAAIVTVYSKQIGTYGNGYTLASSNNTRLAVSGATLANGAALANNQFDFVGTDVETGTDLARAINASTSANIKQTSATVAPSTGVVTVTAKTPGVAGNAITFTSSNGGRLAVTGSGFLAGGSAGAPTQWQF